MLATMSLALEILVWILPSMLLSISVGACVGYGLALRKHGDAIADERQKTLEALHNVLDSAEELTTDVDSHSAELNSVEASVQDIETVDYQAYEDIKESLLGQIAVAIDSNRKLEDNLLTTQHQLEQQAAELDRTRREARLDELSGVGNRKAFDESLRFMLSKYQHHVSTFALLLIDVDHFKRINDTHGHQAGDIVVGLLGETFRDVVRPNRYVSRYGGDEFAILLERASVDSAAVIARRIRDRVEQTNFDAGLKNAYVSVTLSMGLAIADGEDTVESILRKADEALYRSKQQGRNRLCVFAEQELQVQA